MKYGSRLREIIKAHPLNQVEIADKIGVSKSTISFWINSEYPPLDGIEAVCKALELQKVKAGDIKTDVIIEIAEVIDRLREFPAEFKTYTLEGKAGVMREMVSRVVIGEGTARIEWKTPFSWIIQTVPYEAVLTGTLKHAGMDEFRTLCADILLKWAA